MKVENSQLNGPRWLSYFFSFLSSQCTIQITRNSVLDYNMLLNVVFRFNLIENLYEKEINIFQLNFWNARFALWRLSSHIASKFPKRSHMTPVLFYTYRKSSLRKLCQKILCQENAIERETLIHFQRCMSHQIQLPRTICFHWYFWFQILLKESHFLAFSIKLTGGEKIATRWQVLFFKKVPLEIRFLHWNF